MKNVLPIIMTFLMVLPSKAQIWLVEDTYKEITPTVASSSSPEYDFTMIKGMSASKLYIKRFALTVGQTLPISITNSSKNSNAFFFLVSNPDTYSIAFQTRYNENENVYYGDTIAVVPESGEYMLLLVTANNESSSCQLTIGDSTYYASYNRRYLPCVQGTEKASNTFANSLVGTCELFVVEGEDPGRIVAYSNGYDGISDFDWGTTARIRKKYTSPTSGVYVSLNAYPGMSMPSGDKLNLFAGLKEEKKLRVYFQNLRQEDAIRTASATGTYNCIAWAGGEWSHWEWPPMSLSDNYSFSDIASFDSYFDSRGLVRNDAAADLAVVDLWAKVEGTDTIYTHASVRANANIYTYGYGWESKAGQLERFLHPRNALNGNSNRGYGQIVHHYTKKPIQILPSYGSGFIMELEPVFENIEFSQAELLEISIQALSVPSTTTAEFEYLYGIVEDSLNNSSFSNPDMLLENDDYLDLLILCLDEPQTNYLVFQKLSQGDMLSVKLLEDLLVADNQGTMSQVRSYINTHQVNGYGQKVRRTIQSNATLFVKYLLGDGLQSNIPERDITYSDDERIMNVKVLGNDVSISINLDNDAVVSLNMASTFGQDMRSVLNQQKIGKGTYEVTVNSVQKGLYTVSSLINGKIYSKKISIK